MRKGLVSMALGAVLLAGASADASNMGFKLTRTLTASQPQAVSLPYFVSYADAAAMYTDITNSGGSNACVSSYNNALGGYDQYCNSFGDVNFAITKGTYYEVLISNTVNWVIVGSHDPAASVAVAASQVKFLAAPYHTTAVDAAALFNQLTAAGGSSICLSDYNVGIGGFDQYCNSFGDVNFSIVPGRGYQLLSATGFNWIPAHY